MGNIGPMSPEADLTAFAFPEFVDDNFESRLDLRLFTRGIAAGLLRMKVRLVLVLGNQTATVRMPTRRQTALDAIARNGLLLNDGCRAQNG
mmetsp:Transcript_99248/g.167321  ORF Transcript_99248/g.167321 Transcript_99248/m.167321 type:complete len:91 (-) Transcript_99248:1026-1298(-)